MARPPVALISPQIFIHSGEVSNLNIELNKFSDDGEGVGIRGRLRKCAMDLVLGVSG
jgi:hypothetical protein